MCAACGKDCAGAILFAADGADLGAGEAIQILGGNVTSTTFTPLWRDAKSYEDLRRPRPKSAGCGSGAEYFRGALVIHERLPTGLPAS